MRKSRSSSARIDNPRLFPACFGGFAIRRQLPISDLQSASSNGARTKKYQFRRISNPQRNRSNLFCLRISNPQERLRLTIPACSPLVSVDLQSAASYLFRICNPLQVTAQERKSTSFGGFQIRKEIGRTFFCLRISNPQERLRRIEAPACFGGFAIRRQLPISDLQSASSNGARTKKYQFRRISNPQRNRSNLFLSADFKSAGTPTED